MALIEISIAILFLMQNVYCVDDTKPLGKYLYEDLKCQPNVNVNATTDVITSYNCNVAAKNHCILEGKKFEDGQAIRDNGTHLYCRSSCYCSEGSFECAEDDCFEEIHAGCRGKQSLTECCQEETCEPSQINCTVEGKTYMEGTTFYPQNQCLICLCQKGFDGKLDERNCIKRRCLEQIFHMDQLAKNCAATYYLGDQCCPTTWVCNNNQTIVKISDDDSKSGLSCNFGNDKVPYGHGFETTVRPFSRIVKVRCECRLPPFVTCLEISENA